MLESTYYIAGLAGPMLFVVGLALLMHQDYYKKMGTDFMKNPGLVYLSGLAVLLLGLVLVQYHNVWEGALQIIVSLLGWLALVKGLVLILGPEWANGYTKKMLTRNVMKYAGLGYLVVGAYVTYLIYLV